jgi:hypothetical protein
MTSASTSGLCDWNKCLLQSRDAKTCDAIMAIVDAGKKSWTVQGHVLPLLMLMRRLKRSRPLPKGPLGPANNTNAMPPSSVSNPKRHSGRQS